MHIIFFTHPDFLNHQSMPRFTRMLARGMKERGHKIEIWAPKPTAFNLPFPASLKKWLGYVDQYVFFPMEVRGRLKKIKQKTLFVFTDQALGPWIPLVRDRPHIIHCHDFLAQFSAVKQNSENPTGWSGKQYQKMIYRGYTKGKNFISVSRKTKRDLHYFLPANPEISKVVYNGLNRDFSPGEAQMMRQFLQEYFRLELSSGYILHVGGNQWYKNRSGVIEIYNSWRHKYNQSIPLLLIGQSPDKNLEQKHVDSPYKNDIHFLTKVPDEVVKTAYSGATVFLFPSLAEGFGWPIAEAMASGCPVITTDEAPMTEVAGEAGFLISRQPKNSVNIENWANDSAEVLNTVINLTQQKREEYIGKGIVNARRFDQDKALDEIERIYGMVLSKTKN
ncbi:glycosyltransferase family 1 protein [Salegentibacter sp. F188]|uniref:Glycosyltransferase family 1 protein n=1 Tax=Autumnicola patrickiae TaxID=3075591 RepID=A0ABU3DYN9_9FLAO|nr:glycosyltransferase family 1 protein [Salegentibacter sp. F188]MDT0688831.1 glycosyltransferase family 1 protein [Salegentibacter sp. F188]